MTFLVRRKGLEPPTYWFVASHSIQLSYQRILFSSQAVGGAPNLKCSFIIAYGSGKSRIFFDFSKENWF